MTKTVTAIPYPSRPFATQEQADRAWHRNEDFLVSGYYSANIAIRINKELAEKEGFSIVHLKRDRNAPGHDIPITKKA